MECKRKKKVNMWKNGESLVYAFSDYTCFVDFPKRVETHACACY